MQEYHHLYAFLEGLALGAISLFAEIQYPWNSHPSYWTYVWNTCVSLIFYKSGLIKPTENFRLMIFSATAGIAILYLVSFIMSFFVLVLGLFILTDFWNRFSLFVVAIGGTKFSSRF